MKYWLVILMLLGALQQPAYAGGKRIGILAFDGVLTSDITAPLEVFGVASKKSWFADYQVVLISVKQQSTITTEEGLTLSVDSWIGRGGSFDALIVPSGYDMQPLLNNPQLLRFIKDVNAKASYMASNC